MTPTNSTNANNSTSKLSNYDTSDLLDIWLLFLGTVFVCVFTYQYAIAETIQMVDYWTYLFVLATFLQSL